MMLKQCFLMILGLMVSAICSAEVLVKSSGFEESNNIVGQKAVEEEQALDAIVKIFAVKSSPGFSMPWQNGQQSQGTGSGVVIKDGLILTNAHVVANHAFLMVRKQGDPTRYVAKAVAVCHTADLALLKVEDKLFYKDITPLEFGDLPELQEEVSVIGYPVGGDSISITKGVVSRIEPVIYSHSHRTLLAIQVDAAINPGNSGGPVLLDNKIIGLAFQTYLTRQSMGHVIPQPVINHFLNDFYNKRPLKFPVLKIGVTTMENPDLRTWAKMRKGDTGILITTVTKTPGKTTPFKINDVILAIDNKTVANNGSIQFRENEVIDFKYLIRKKYVGEKVNFKLLRDGKEIVVDYQLTVPNKLVKSRRYNITPEYYFVGGLLFVPLDMNFLESWKNWWNSAPRELVNFRGAVITKDRKEIVVLANVLPDAVNVGYQNIKYSAVKKLNGKKVVDLKSFVRNIENIKTGFVILELYNNSKIVLDVKKMRASTKRIMGRYRIPYDRSESLINVAKKDVKTPIVAAKKNVKTPKIAVKKDVNKK